MGPFKCNNLSTKRLLLILTIIVIMTLFRVNYFISINCTQLVPSGVVVRKVGGLGNQLFVYACMYAFAKKSRVPLYLEMPDSSNIVDTQVSVVAFNL